MSDEKVVDFEENKKKGGKIKKWAGNLKEKIVYAKDCIIGNADEDDKMGNYNGGLWAGVGLSLFVVMLTAMAVKNPTQQAINNAMTSHYLKGQRDEAEKLLGDSVKTIIDSNNTEE